MIKDQVDLVSAVLEAIEALVSVGLYGPYRVLVPREYQALYFMDYYRSDALLRDDGLPLTTKDRILMIESVSLVQLDDDVRVITVVSLEG